MYEWGNSNTYTRTGSGAYVTSFSFTYTRIGKLVVWTLTYKPNTNISSSTGDVRIGVAPRIKNDYATAIATGDTNDNSRDRDVKLLNASSTEINFKALGAHTSGVTYYASGAYVVE